MKQKNNMSNFDVSNYFLNSIYFLRFVMFNLMQSTLIKYFYKIELKFIYYYKKEKSKKT